jgi:hypothetical protein
MGRTPGLPISWAAPLVIGLMAPYPAHALEMSGGLSLGGFQAGTVPRLAISPHAGISWNRTRYFLITIHDTLSILPPTSMSGWVSITRPPLQSGLRRRGPITALDPRSRYTT